MNRNLVFIITGVLLLALSGGVVYSQFFKTDKQTDETGVLAAVGSESDGSLEDYASKQNSNTQVTNQQLQITENKNSTIPLGQPSNNFQNAPQQNTLLSPDQFSEYDSFINGDSVAYIDIVQGNGAEATSGSTPVVLYTGWLTNGQIFDQSRPNEEGVMQAFSFQLGSGQVISGWDQGVAGMKVGGKRRLIIPPAFGYGPTGQASIPPNAVLIFDVELVQVQ